MYFAPFILSEVVTGVVWRQIYRPDGLFDQILASVGASDLTRSGWTRKLPSTACSL